MSQMSGLPVSEKWTMAGDVYIVCLLFRLVLFSVQKKHIGVTPHYSTCCSLHSYIVIPFRPQGPVFQNDPPGLILLDWIKS